MTVHVWNKHTTELLLQDALHIELKTIMATITVYWPSESALKSKLHGTKEELQQFWVNPVNLTTGVVIKDSTHKKNIIHTALHINLHKNDSVFLKKLLMEK